MNTVYMYCVEKTVSKWFKGISEKYTRIYKSYPEIKFVLCISENKMKAWHNRILLL